MVDCTSTASEIPFRIEVHHYWSPHGAKRFVELVEDNFFTDIALFRCVPNFIVQFGISNDLKANEKWSKTIPDDPSWKMQFKQGMLSYAGGGPDSRTHQVFIAFEDSDHLGKSPWETPFGRVIAGYNETVAKFSTVYGDQQPFNPNGVDQGRLSVEGNAYLQKEFPKLDYIKECHVVKQENALGYDAFGNPAIIPLALVMMGMVGIGIYLQKRHQHDELKLH